MLSIGYQTFKHLSADNYVEIANDLLEKRFKHTKKHSLY